MWNPCAHTLRLFVLGSVKFQLLLRCSRERPLALDNIQAMSTAMPTSLQQLLAYSLTGEQFRWLRGEDSNLRKICVDDVNVS